MPSPQSFTRDRIQAAEFDTLPRKWQKYFSPAPSSMIDGNAV